MLDLHNTHKLDKTRLSPKEALLNLCDEFTEFNDCCAFFCESVSRIASDKELISVETAQGLKRFAYSLKAKSIALQCDLKKIQAASQAWE